MFIVRFILVACICDCFEIRLIMICIGALVASFLDSISIARFHRFEYFLETYKENFEEEEKQTGATLTAAVRSWRQFLNSRWLCVDRIASTMPSSCRSPSVTLYDPQIQFFLQIIKILILPEFRIILMSTCTILC